MKGPDWHCRKRIRHPFHAHEARALHQHHRVRIQARHGALTSASTEVNGARPRRSCAPPPRSSRRARRGRRCPCSSRIATDLVVNLGAGRRPRPCRRAPARWLGPAVASTSMPTRTESGLALYESSRTSAPRGPARRCRRPRVPAKLRQPSATAACPAEPAAGQPARRRRARCARCAGPAPARRNRSSLRDVEFEPRAEAAQGFTARTRPPDGRYRMSQSAARRCANASSRRAVVGVDHHHAAAPRWPS